MRCGSYSLKRKRNCAVGGRCYRPCWIGRSKVNYEDPKGFLREPLSCQAEESCLRECTSVKEIFRVSDDDVREAGVPQGDDIAARVTVRYGGGIAIFKEQQMFY